MNCCSVEMDGNSAGEGTIAMFFRSTGSSPVAHTWKRHRCKKNSDNRNGSTDERSLAPSEMEIPYNQ